MGGGSADAYLVSWLIEMDAAAWLGEWTHNEKWSGTDYAAAENVQGLSGIRRVLMVQCTRQETCSRVLIYWMCAGVAQVVRATVS
jgi:hypothetical protein